jgi:predicted ATPase/DNA-binding CsgD family transcriptional regulator
MLSTHPRAQYRRPVARRTSASGNLPAETTSFIGRRHELAESRRKLSVARLVTLVGPGGVGKTRLAIRLAADLGRGVPDGAWLVQLAELRDPALVGNAVLTALDLRDQGVAGPVALLRSYLGDKEMLLVLDNCEHLLQAAARLTSDLLKAAPGVRVLATSREPLSVDGEHVLPVPPLQLPSPDAEEPLDRLRQNETVLLFVERAAAASGSFDLTPANQAAVVELCRRLDGLPLAIELAAVRTRALSPEQIRDRLGERFDLLTGGSRAALPRHQTLRTTIEWSHGLLTPAERTLLARLCVFAGRFTLDDVAAVCASDDLPPVGVLDHMSSLVDKSLVIKEDVAGAACYRLHETMREYARLKLRDAGDEVLVEQRCVDYYVTRCRQFAVEGRHRLLEWLPWVELQIDTIRGVLRRSLDQGDIPAGSEIATYLMRYWITRATTEGVRWLDELFAAGAQRGAQPGTYFVRGFLAVLQSDAAAAVPALERCVRAARETGPPDALSRSLSMASIGASMAGDRDSSRRLLEEARIVADGLGDLGATLMLHQAQALNGLLEGDLAAVGPAAAEGARLSREAGDVYSLEMMLMNQALAAVMSGDLRECELRSTEGLRIADQLDDRVAQCYLLGALACCAAGKGEHRRAAQLLGATESVRAEAGASIHIGLAPALDRAHRSATAALGPASFASDFVAGQQLTRQLASRLALRERAPAAAGAAALDRRSSRVLSRRGAEVAQLVAEGLTNREIGARLFISERTVESHVRTVLNTLGFTSRAQIAGWVASGD